MTLSPTTRSRSGTETAWSKKGSPLKTSSAQSKIRSKTGANKRPTAKLASKNGTKLASKNVAKAAPKRSPKNATKRKSPAIAVGTRSIPGEKGKYVFYFGGGKTEGNELQKNLLGGKGANLHGMTSLGLPVPPGFTISTEVCTHFYANRKTYPKVLDSQVKASLAKIEKEMGRKFGGRKNPLLVSVRSGARASMPGMMDTILNLGLNDQTVLGLIEESQDARFSYDSYRRFITMYSDVVLDIHSNQFESALEDMKHARGVELDTELSAEDLKELVRQFKQIVRTSGKQFPEDPWEQLWGAVGAVFSSWMNPRANTYRKLNDIPEAWGTAVNIQSMVFGNMGDDCATGVAFTRDPSTGERKFFGEFLVNAQGEDVVAGIRTPQPINAVSRQEGAEKLPTLEGVMPKAYGKLVKVYQKLEKHYRDMQDIEFTIERGKLYMLQTRSGKRTAAAALKIAVDMVREKLITKEEAILRVKPEQLDQLLHPMIDPKAKKDTLCKGLPASPGAAFGQVVFDPDVAEKWVNELGRKVILVRIETSPEDIHGMAVAQGILTARGGMTSHAAVVARGMGKCCVSGCSAIKITYEQNLFSIGNTIIKEGDFITLDGTTGEVIKGKVDTITPTLNKDFQELMVWVDQIRQLEVRTNADTPHDAKVAREFGAQGIGLCRTEHMFFEADRIDSVREMILADTLEGREIALEKILPMQKGDFKGLFREMKGLPVTIRLLDPPLHEFIPHKDVELYELADKTGVSFERLKRKADTLHEFNPMLGHRGCRLGVSYPEIYRTQVRAIMEAACELIQEEGFRIVPEIMIPLVGDWRELRFCREYCVEEADAVIARFNDSLSKNGTAAKTKKITIEYHIGTMIELPRAALTAGEIAKYAEFFSFGTNDLTQTTFGLSRDDSGMFLKDYLDAKIYEKDPFASLDPQGVGRLMKIAIQEGREARPDLKLGICGEHGGEPQSVMLCHAMGLDYVSCSPFRVPIARLAAAHAAIENPRKAQKALSTKKKK
ncbi:MAG: pyruvate, phosphate dikinase [Methylotenera sp.]|nr:pyruvate, phosphate dikinase [Oligoflexia bacterium]